MVKHLFQCSFDSDLEADGVRIDIVVLRSGESRVVVQGLGEETEDHFWYFDADHATAHAMLENVLDHPELSNAVLDAYEFKYQCLDSM